MTINLEHHIVNINKIQIHAEIESDIISSDSIFVFIYPLVFKVKKKKIKPIKITNQIAIFNFELDFVGKNTVKVYEDKELVKEYVYEKNDADELR